MLTILTTHFNMKLVNWVFISVFICLSCSSLDSNRTRSLPILGERQIVDGDTLYHTIPDFQFVNQDSLIVTSQTFEGGIYVADFFFTSCPTICPQMSAQMLRLQEAFADNPQVKLLSHSIDFVRDSVATLKSYAEKLEIDGQKWHLVTGPKEKVYQIAKSYLVPAQEDKNAPGGYLHSGAFILIDSEKHIRNYYDGTKPEEVDQLIKDIEYLLTMDQS